MDLKGKYDDPRDTMEDHDDMKGLLTGRYDDVKSKMKGHIDRNESLIY